MSEESLPHLTCDEIADCYRQPTTRCLSSGRVPVFQIEYQQNHYIAKFLPQERAYRQIANTQLAKALRIKAADMLVLPYAHSKINFALKATGEKCDTVLLAEKAPGVCFADMTSAELRNLTQEQKFQDEMRHDMLAFSVMGYHDAAMRHGFYDSRIGTTWIDVEFGIATKWPNNKDSGQILSRYRCVRSSEDFQHFATIPEDACLYHQAKELCDAIPLYSGDLQGIVVENAQDFLPRLVARADGIKDYFEARINSDLR